MDSREKYRCYQRGECSDCQWRDTEYCHDTTFVDNRIHHIRAFNDKLLNRPGLGGRPYTDDYTDEELGIQ